MTDLGEKMRKRSTRRATTYGVAAIVSLSLIAAACGGAATTTPTMPEPAPRPTETDGSAAPDGTEGGEATEPTGTEVVEGELEENVVTVAPDETPVPGGTLRYGLEADVDGLNPTSSALSAPGLMMANAVFDTLTAFDEDGVAVPYLAESVEPVDRGRLLQVDRHDPSGHQLPRRHAGHHRRRPARLRDAEGRSARRTRRQAVLSGDGRHGAHRRLPAQFNLLEPNAYFPGALTGQLGYVSSPTWLAAALADPTLNQQPVGSGPFVFDSRSADSVTRFVRNEDWWNGDVYLDAVEFVPVPDADTRAELLVQGDINALQTSDPGAIQTLDDDPSIQQIKDETGEEGFVMINTGMAPFDDIRAREALTLATPVENYLNLIGLGDLRPASQRFIPESQYYNPDVVQVTDDPAAAKALSDAYCADLPENCSDGKINMELQFPAGSVVLEQTGDLLIQGWGESFNVEIQTIPQDEHIQEAALGQYNAVLWRQFGAEDPALDNVWLLCRTVGGISLNWPKSCDPARDELLLAGPGQHRSGRAR